MRQLAMVAAACLLATAPAAAKPVQRSAKMIGARDPKKLGAFARVAVGANARPNAAQPTGRRSE